MPALRPPSHCQAPSRRQTPSGLSGARCPAAVRPAESPQREQARTERQGRYWRGLLAEGLAIARLMLSGYRILSWRWRSPAGELDLVAVRGQRLAFVEVKQRQLLEDAIDAITPRQQSRIRRASELWLQRHPAYGRHDLAFDVIYVTRAKRPATALAAADAKGALSAAGRVLASVAAPLTRALGFRPHYVPDAFQHALPRCR